MNRLLPILIWTLVLLFSLEPFAQVDSSSRLLLRSGTQKSEDYESSSRYTIRPKKQQIIRQQEPKRQPKQFKQEQKNVKQDAQPVPQSVVDEAEGFAINPVKYEKEIDKNLKEELRDTLWGGSSEKIVQYKSLLHHKDTRRNTIEIDFAPGYFYNDSSSGYWFRSHYSHGAKMDVALSVWLTPFFGIRTGFGTSMGATIKGLAGGNKNLEVDNKDFMAGIRFRSYFGLSRKAKSLNFGMDFDENQFNVPSDATQRYSTRSSGMRLSLESIVPSSNSQSWVWGVEFLPSRSHEENKSASDIKSGTGNSSNAIGIWLGKKIVFDRKNQFFWKVSHRSEKNVFDGQANTLDPILAIQPEGVTVTNSTTQFHLGFTWGR